MDFRLCWKLVSWGMFLLIAHRMKFQVFSLLYLCGSKGVEISQKCFILHHIDCFMREIEWCENIGKQGRKEMEARAWGEEKY